MLVQDLLSSSGAPWLDNWGSKVLVVLQDGHFFENSPICDEGSLKSQAAGACSVCSLVGPWHRGWCCQLRSAPQSQDFAPPPLPPPQWQGRCLLAAECARWSSRSGGAARSGPSAACTASHLSQRQLGSDSSFSAQKADGSDLLAGGEQVACISFFCPILPPLARHCCIHCLPCSRTLPPHREGGRKPRVVPSLTFPLLRLGFSHQSLNC